MASIHPSSEHVIVHLPARSEDWAGVLAQFTLIIAAREGQLYAKWAAERLLRAIETSDGMAALLDGRLLGLILFEIVDDTAEISLPWTARRDHLVMQQLAGAVLQELQESHPDLCHIRAERQLLPGDMPVSGLEQVGFVCHWRKRMVLELAGWHELFRLPQGVRLEPWNIRYLDAAAELVFSANTGTLDACLYAPFFGTSPVECRKGLLAILAGKFGQLDQQATQCAFCGDTLAGINLIVTEERQVSTIVEISVAPAFQGRGIGRALLIQSLTVLRDRGAERAELAVTCDNTRAVSLYESLGFLDIGTFPVCVWPRTSLTEQ